MTDTFDFLANAHNGGGLSQSEAIQLANRATSKSRARRNALYRYVKLINSLSPEAKSFHKDNKNAIGLPRTYTVRVVKDDFVPDIDPSDVAAACAIEGKSFIIGQHGISGTALRLGDVPLPGRHVSWSEATRSYAFDSNVKIYDTGSHDPQGAATVLAPTADVSGYLSFLGSRPAGSISVGEATANVELDIVTTWYDVDVAADAGAYWDTANKRLKWDATLPKWQEAHWETGKLIYGYDLVKQEDEIDPTWVAQNVFLDCASSPPATFKLSANEYGPSGYTCIIGVSTDQGAPVSTEIHKQPPPVPAERKSSGSPIACVFPKLWNIQMSMLADEFVGAYRDDAGVVYAVRGRLRFEDFVSDRPANNEDPSAIEVGVESSAPVPELYASTPSLQQPAPKQAVHGLMSYQSMVPNVNSFSESSEIMTETEKTNDAPSASKLSIHGLMAYNPMVADLKDPSGFRDVVAQAAMKDLQDIVIYHMDKDLRETFVSKTDIKLDPFLMQLATDDPANVAYYKSLQVPLITSLIAQGTTDPAKNCNGARAAALLKSIPSESPVYKRHSAKLYRYQFLSKFDISKYLEDQQKGSYTQEIQRMGTNMKKYLLAKAEGHKEKGDKAFDASLQKSLAEIDSLAKWAQKKRLYWAMRLLYQEQKAATTQWYAQLTSGNITSSVGMAQKRINSLFGILEDDMVPTEPGGRSFMQTFNEQMRFFQMTTILPQLVDYKGNKSQIDSLVQQCIADFIENPQGVDMKEHQDALKAAIELHNDKSLRLQMFYQLGLAMRSGSTLGSWSTVMDMWAAQLQPQPWFAGLANKAKILQVGAYALIAVLVVFPYVSGNAEGKGMDQQTKTLWRIATAGVFLFCMVKAIQGVMRLRSVYEYLANYKDCIRVLFGNQKIIDQLGMDARAFENACARNWFTRTTDQTSKIAAAQALAEEGAILAEEGAMNRISDMQKCFGRNLGETIAVTVALIMAVLSIILIAMDLDRKKDGILQAMDWIMITSSILQILSIGSGWVATWFSLGETALAVLNFFVGWGGFIAAALAAIGLLIFCIWYFFIFDKRDPIQKFVEDRAKPAGLWIANPSQAPEYLVTVPPNEQSSSMPGLAFKGPLLSAHPINLIPTGFVRLGASEGAIEVTDTVDYTTDTVWSHNIESNGESLIYTCRVTEDTKTKEKLTTMWYLGTDKDNKVIATTLGSLYDPNQKKVDFSSVHWRIELQDPPTVDDDTKKILSAKARIMKGKLDLVRNVSLDGVVQQGLAMADIEQYRAKFDQYSMSIVPTEAPNPIPSFIWELEMQALGPGHFEYSESPWQLNKDSRDESIYPQFDKTTSQGLEWTISPALDDKYFELVKQGTGAGIVKQKEGVEPLPMTVPIEYTVTCKLIQKKQSKGSSSAKFTLEVKDTAMVKPAPEVLEDIQKWDL